MEAPYPLTAFAILGSFLKGWKFMRVFVLVGNCLKFAFVYFLEISKSPKKRNLCFSCFFRVVGFGEISHPQPSHLPSVTLPNHPSSSPSSLWRATKGIPEQHPKIKEKQLPKQLPKQIPETCDFFRDVLYRLRVFDQNYGGRAF